MKNIVALIKVNFWVFVIMGFIKIIQHLMVQPDANSVFTIAQIAALFGLCVLCYAKVLVIIVDVLKKDDNGKPDNNNKT